MANYLRRQNKYILIVYKRVFHRQLKYLSLFFCSSLFRGTCHNSLFEIKIFIWLLVQKK